jgi:hypothetical protein
MDNLTHILSAIEQATARRKQVEAAVAVAEAEVASSPAKLPEARAGAHRADADVAR